MDKITLTRSELHSMVWAEPFTQLSKKYDLSDNGFRKLCNKFKVPYPRNGYWQKVKSKKPVVVAKLSKDYKGEETIILEPRIPGAPDKPESSPMVLRTREILQDPQAPLEVTEHIIKPHPLIAQTRQYYSELKKNRNYRNENLEVVYLRVEDANRKRALFFMHALVQLLAYRGHTIAKGRYGGTVATIDAVEIPFSLREATKRIPATTSWGTSEYVPTGELILKVGEYSREKEWRDGKTKIESMLAKIVAKFELDAEYEKELRIRIELNHQRYEQEKRLKEEQERLRQEEKKKFDKLWDDAQNYNRAETIRSYLQALKEKMQQEQTFGTETEMYLEWAQKQADSIDPLMRISEVSLKENQ